MTQAGRGFFSVALLIGTGAVAAGVFETSGLWGVGIVFAVVALGALWDIWSPTRGLSIALGSSIILLFVVTGLATVSVLAHLAVVPPWLSWASAASFGAAWIFYLVARARQDTNRSAPRRTPIAP